MHIFAEERGMPRDGTVPGRRWSEDEEETELFRLRPGMTSQMNKSGEVVRDAGAEVETLGPPPPTYEQFSNRFVGSSYAGPRTGAGRLGP